MLDFIQSLFINFWQLLNVISFYIILGLLIASVMKQYINDSFIKCQLGGDSKLSVLKASMLGIPLPLCSCSVVPFALSLKKSGANKSSITSFLISTPVIGVDSMLASYGAFGWFFAIFRVLSSFITALIAGFVSLFFEKKEKNHIKFVSFSTTLPSSNCDSQDCGCKATDKKDKNFLKTIFEYAFYNLFKDIAKPMLLGLIFASLLMSVLPKELDIFLTQNLLLSYIFMLLISIPLYICATSSIPLGIALMIAGFSPGSAFVLLSAGPATSMVTIGIVKKILGQRGLLIYLGVIITSTICFAFIIDVFFADLVQINTIISDEDDSPSLISNIASLLFLTMLYKSLK
ncbi:SO_0444 family Cu/Zn efflux transporter [Arcobacter sp. FWKO B]|uniref:SO_0444 family Cu/Zn efflux transporter n=1 Tax=Arcobacter sp. FWKO B TaxID=2593672 RepID=UPI001905C171|nr:SO_0444 family Cu/Zn efflux transporter [Arcobacter sp. FWKO B]